MGTKRNVRFADDYTSFEDDPGAWNNATYTPRICDTCVHQYWPKRGNDKRHYEGRCCDMWKDEQQWNDITLFQWNAINRKKCVFYEEDPNPLPIPS